MSALTFASPGLAVAAGAAIAVPVAIHLLLRRRRMPVEWAAMDLLREALRRVERRRRVERWLLLAVRCLVVACAGMAIAAPFVGMDASAARAPRTLVVVLDDSAASSERLGKGTAFERSVAVAKAAVESLSAGDRVALVQASRAGSASRDPASLDQRGALQRLGTLTSSESACDLAASLEASAAILANAESTGTVQQVLVASAFRSGSVGAMPPLPKLGSDAAPVTLLAPRPPAPEGANLRLAALEPERVAGQATGTPAALRVTVQRDRGDGPLRTTVRVAGPTLTTAAERPVELAAGERERAVTVQLSERPPDPANTLRRAVVATISADAQPVDDARAVVLAPVERLRAVVVDRRSFDAGGAIDRLPAGEWVMRALAPGDPPTMDASLVDPAALDARTAASADAVILAQPQLVTAAQWVVLQAFVARGGVLAVLPTANERVQAWGASFAKAFDVPWKLGLEARDLPAAVALAAEQPASSYLGGLSGEVPQLAPAVSVFRSLDVDASMDPGAAQVVLANNAPFVLSWRPRDSRGTVVLLTAAVDLSWTTLPLKPMMVPLWQELVAEGRRRASAALVARVGSQPLVDRPGVVELRPVAPDGGAMPGARSIAVGPGGRTTAPIERGGLLEMLDAGGRSIGMLAAVVDPAWTSVAPVEQERINAWLGASAPVEWVDDGGIRQSSVPAATVTIRRSGAVSPWLFAAALALALVEALLARRFSHAVKPTAAAPRHDATRVAAGGAA